MSDEYLKEQQALLRVSNSRAAGEEETWRWILKVKDKVGRLQGPRSENDALKLRLWFIYSVGK